MRTLTKFDLIEALRHFSNLDEIVVSEEIYDSSNTDPSGRGILIGTYADGEPRCGFPLSKVTAIGGGLILLE